MKRSMPVRILMLVAVGALAAACTTAPAASTASAASASASALTVQEEITAASNGLDDALAAYKAGDAKKADQLVGDAYLDHFEFVEGPLGKVDMALMEKLEDLIRAGIRDAIKGGKPIADVEALVTEAKADLATAATKLK